MKKLLSTLSIALVLLTATAFAGETSDSGFHDDDTMVESILDLVGIGHN